jgi:hypothetical protein
MASVLAVVPPWWSSPSRRVSVADFSLVVFRRALASSRWLWAAGCVGVLAGGFGDDACQVVVSSAGEARVPVLGAGGPVDEEHSGVGGHALRLVNRHGLAEGDVFLDVVAGEGDLASAVQGFQQQRATSLAVRDPPAVAVSDPCAGGSDQATIVLRGDDVVASADGMVADGDPAGLDLAAGHPCGSGAPGELVDSVVIGGHHRYGSAVLAGVDAGLVGGLYGLLATSRLDSAPLDVLVDNGLIASAEP